MLSTDNNASDSTRDSDLESLVKYTRLSDDGVMTIVPSSLFAIIYLVNSLNRKN